MRRWAMATNSYAARSRACGHTCRQTPETIRRMTRASTRPTFVISLAALVWACVAGVFIAAQGTPVPQASSAQAQPAAQVQLATIGQYCAGCHNDRAKTAGVSFDGLRPESISQRADVFEKAVRKLRGRVMPPPGARQPAAAAVD